MPDAAGSVGTTPEFGWLEGIVTGPRVESPGLARALRQLSAIGLASVDVSADGGRFVVLFDDASIAGSQLTHDRLDELTNVLNDIAEAVAESGQMESSLRCTEVFPGEARETLFLVEGFDVRALSRTRSLTPTDAQRAPAVASAGETIGWGRVGFIGALLLVVFLLVAWTGGWIDALFAAPAESLTVRRGPFGDLVTATVSSDWGRYKVEIRRGPDYPQSSADVERLLQATTTPSERAAVNLVADGGGLWVRLAADDDTVTFATEISVAVLLEEADARVVATTPGRMNARSVVLALSSGRKDR